MFENRLIQVSVFISIFISPILSSYNYRKQHPSTKLLAQPGIFPRIDRLLNRYGSMHSMREYIFWAVRDESISINLRKKLTYVLIEKRLVEHYLKTTTLCKKPLILKHAANLAPILFNRLKDLKNADNAAKRILKVYWKKMYGLWADSRDMYLSTTGLLMFQKMYLWPPAIILQDLNITTSYQTKLTYKQAMVIGMCGLYRRTYTFSVEWFETAEQIAREALDEVIPHKNVFIPIDLIVKLRDLSIQEHNQIARELECWINYDCHMYLFTKPIRYTSGNAYLTRLTRRKGMLPKYSRLGTAGLAEDQLINLCSGSEQSILPPEMQINLKCYYEKRRHPYLYIGPVKTEQLSESPLIFQYYDILSPKLVNEAKANFIKNATIPVLVKYVEHYNGKREIERVDPTPGYITSITVKFEGNPIFSQFAEMVTGIKFDGAAEKLQYMDYTPGKLLRAHEDVDHAYQEDPEREIDGNRFADLLYYLELPTLGGQTPFCQAGVRAHLAVGSLVIWINKFRNGTNRDDVFHGGCPVIHGNKMILAQGIRYTGQENHFKCTLNQFE